VRLFYIDRIILCQKWNHQ